MKGGGRRSARTGRSGTRENYIYVITCFSKAFVSGCLHNKVIYLQFNVCSTDG